MSRRTTRTDRTDRADRAGTAGRTSVSAARRPRGLRRLAVLAVVPVLLAGCSVGGDEAGGGGGTGGGTGASAGPRTEAPSTGPSASPSTDPSVTVPPSPDLASYYSQDVTWVGCEAIDPPEGVTGQDHECATVQVPLDYDAPGEGAVILALTRLPATGERLGSLLINPGGPGGSGVDYALAAGTTTSERLRESYDVVGFDPRGVARSSGVDCLDDAGLGRFLAADPSPDDAREVAAVEDIAAEVVAGCADDRVAPYVDSVSVARDMDVLRAVLGDARLTFLGKSYGTVLGALYAELFPDRVGRMVLDGAVDVTSRPAADATLDVEQLQGFEVALESFVADCSTQRDCPLTGSVEDGVGQVRALLASLDRAPLPTGDPDRPLTQGLGVAAVLNPLYSYDTWPALRAGLGAALSGDGEVMLFLVDLFTERREDGTYRGNLYEALLAVNCLDGRSDPAGKAALTRDDLEAAAEELAREAPTFGPQSAYGGLACLDWPFEPVAWPEIDGEGAPPVLVVGTERDPATPLVWAERMADQLASGVLVTFDGDGHTAYSSTGAGCVDEIVDDYLVEGVVPEDGVACTADY